MTFEQRERTYAIVRLVIGAIAIILGMFGLTVDQEAWATVTMEVACIALTAYTWFWKDNNISHDRIQKEKFMDALETENEVEFEVEEDDAEEE